MLEFWQRFADGAPSGLQKSVCGAHEDVLVTRLLNGPLKSKVDRLRHTSCKSRNAGAWLTVYPSLPELTLSDMEFRYAVRHRLGLPPHSNLPPRCVCGLSLDSAPWHFHCCPKLRPRAITHRHNQLVQLLASLFRHAGALVQVEAKSPGEERARPDLEIVLINVSWWMYRWCTPLQTASGRSLPSQLPLSLSSAKPTSTNT